MAHFGDFLSDELALVLAMPVRAGFWMSHIDDTPETVRDDARERIALEKVIATIQGKASEGTFIREIMDHAMAHKDFWPQWEETVGTFLKDLESVMYMAKTRLPEDEVGLFQKGIFHIASVVAQAAMEDGVDVDVSQAPGGSIITRIMERLSVKTDLHIPDHISATEQAALQKLLVALKG